MKWGSLKWYAAAGLVFGLWVLYVSMGSYQAFHGVSKKDVAAYVKSQYPKQDFKNLACSRAVVEALQNGFSPKGCKLRSVDRTSDLAADVRISLSVSGLKTPLQLVYHFLRNSWVETGVDAA